LNSGDHFLARSLRRFFELSLRLLIFRRIAEHTTSLISCDVNFSQEQIDASAVNPGMFISGLS